MNETRLDPRTVLVGLGALLLLISLFLDWYGPHGEGSGVSAWTSFEVVDALLAVIAIAALYGVVADHSTRQLPTLAPAARAAGAVAALVLVVVSMLDVPPLLFFSGGALEVGIWLALAGSVLMVAGALIGSVRISVVRTPRQPAPPPPPPPADPNAETRTLP